jgi:hypothetical protein
VFFTTTYFLPTAHGNHDLKAGFEWRDDKETFARIGTSGPVLQEFKNGVPAQVILLDTGEYAQLGSTWTVPVDSNRAEALYFQDRWSASKYLTVTVGARYDRQQPYYTNGKRAPILSAVFPTVATPGATLMTFNNIAPRIGATFDPKGDGKTAVKAYYGRYWFNVAQTISAAVDPGGANFKTYTWNDANSNGVWDGPQENGALVASGGGSSTTFNPTMPNAYTDEIDLSIERQFWRQSSWRLLYVRKAMRNQFGSFNQLWVGQFTNPYTTTLSLLQYNAANPKAPIVTGQQSVTVNDIPNALKGHVSNVIDTLPDGADKATYDTVEAALNKRFPNGMFIMTGFDWTRSRQYNEPSQSTDPLTQADPLGNPGPGGTLAFNTYPAVAFVQPTTQWSYTLSGRYEIPHAAVGIAPNFRVQSGWNYAPFATVALPNAGNQTIFLHDLTLRSDNVPFLSVRADKSFALPGQRSVLLALDCFNILNANPVDNFILNQTASTYNQIIGMLDPRTFELTLRVEF